MQTTSTSNGISRDDLRSSVLAVLERAEKPLLVSQIRKNLPKPFQRPPAELAAFLESLSAEGHVHPRFGRDKAGKPKTKLAGYALEAEPPPPPPPPSPESVILAGLEQGNLSAAELKERLKLQGVTLKAVDFTACLQRLADAGQVHPWRNRTKSGGYAKTTAAYGLEAQPLPDAALFIEATKSSLDTAISKAGALGIGAAAVLAALLDVSLKDFDGLFRELEKRRGKLSAPVLAALSGGDPVEEQRAVLAELRELASRDRAGALIPIRALRRASSVLGVRFDEALLELSRKGSVILHHHDFPGDLPEHERAELVRDRHGTYYVGVVMGGAAS